MYFVILSVTFERQNHSVRKQVCGWHKLETRRRMIFKGVCARAVISNYDTLFNTGVLKVLLVRSQVEMRARY